VRNWWHNLQNPVINLPRLEVIEKWYRRGKHCYLYNLHSDRQSITCLSNRNHDCRMPTQIKWHCISSIGNSMRIRSTIHFDRIPVRTMRKDDRPCCFEPGNGSCILLRNVVFEGNVACGGAKSSRFKVSKMSLMVIGTPCNAPQFSPLASASSACLA
jgi:hypothetical protein